MNIDVVYNRPLYPDPPNGGITKTSPHVPSLTDHHQRDEHFAVHMGGGTHPKRNRTRRSPNQEWAGGGEGEVEEFDAEP